MFPFHSKKKIKTKTKQNKKQIEKVRPTIHQTILRTKHKARKQKEAVC